MKLVMFHPLEHPMERGWVGRIDGEHVIHLAAQTLQSFFTGGASAREHAVYPLDGVRLLAPVLHPPAVRVFGDETSFEFANPAAIVGPGSHVQAGESPSDNPSRGSLELRARVAVVIGAEGELGGFTAFAEWRDPRRRPPKDRDFALGLGPVVLTPDELAPSGLEAAVRVNGIEALRGRLDGFDWMAARDLAADGTSLHPGDLLACPPLAPVVVASGSAVELELSGIGVLDATVAGA